MIGSGIATTPRVKCRVLMRNPSQSLGNPSSQSSRSTPPRQAGRRLAWGLLLPLLPVLPACTPTYTRVPGSSLSILPLRTLRLYETGIGYFERSGAVSGDDTGLPLPAGHLDDALKTLVIYSQDKTARVYGISFPSSVSKGMGRALAGLPQNEDDAVSYRELLLSLKGTALSVRSGEATLNGRLIDVQRNGHSASDKAKEDETESHSDENKAAGKDKPQPAPKPELVLMLLTDSGELVRVPTSVISAIRPLDPTYAGRLGTALDAVTQRGAQSQRMLRLLSREGGPITLGYLTETPLWRVTYRLVLGENKGSAALQGWALIHNDTDEEWRGVKLHLVSGRPDSYLFPMAAPRYTRRALVTPENQLSTVPQLLSNSADRMWGDHIEDSYGSGGLGLSGTGMGGGGTGEGTIGLGSIGTVGHGAGVSSDSSSSLLQVGNLAAAAQSTGIESGSLFTYTMNDAIDLRARSSALLPFINEGVEAEAITTLDKPGASARAGLRLVNSTKQTLPAGPMSIYSDGTLAGETAIERLKPGERRFLEYGSDLDVSLSSVKSQTRDETQRVTFDRDSLEEHFLRRVDALYRIENRSGQARTLYLTLDIGANARVQGADRLDFDSSNNQAIAVFELAAGSRVERAMSMVAGRQTSRRLVTLTATHLAELAQQQTVPAPERAILQEAVLRQRELETAKVDLDKSEADIKKTEKEIERLREHLKAMGHETAAGAVQNPVLKRILDAEDRLAALQKKQETLESDQDKRRDVVRKVLERLPKKQDKPLSLP